MMIISFLLAASDIVALLTVLPPATAVATPDTGAPLPNTPTPALEEGMPPSGPPAGNDVAQPEERSQSGTKVSLKVAVGGYYGGLFAVTTYGASGSVAVGGRRKDSPITAYGGLRLYVGRTEHALPVQAFQVTFGPDLALGRARLGLDGNLGYFRIGVNTARSALETASVGVGAHASFDFARLSDADNVYVLAAFCVDFVEASGQGPPLWTTALSLGYRWDSHPSRRR